MIKPNEMTHVIQEYVLSERLRQKISEVDQKYKSELSGEMHGEFEMLLDRQLLTTEVGYAGWRELEDPVVLEGVYTLVQIRISESVEPSQIR